MLARHIHITLLCYYRNIGDNFADGMTMDRRTLYSGGRMIVADNYPDSMPVYSQNFEKKKHRVRN